MTVTITQVRSWDLATLVSSADSADVGAETFENSALTVTNGLAGVDPSWDGNSRDHAALRTANESSNLTERAARWRAAATELRTADEQLGLLKAEIERLVDEAKAKSSVVGPVYSIADDGSVSVTAAFRSFYAKSQGTNPGIGLVQEAENTAAQLERQLKLLLANASMGAEYADWKITNALLGVTAEQRPFHPTEAILKPPQPKEPRMTADQDSSGPNDYNSVDPKLLDQLGLMMLRDGARFGGQSTYKVGLKQSPKLLNHFLTNRGSSYTVDVDAILSDLPIAGERAEQQAVGAFEETRSLLPAEYTGPIVYEGTYGGPLGQYRADPTTDPDWYLALGTFSFESSGVAIPNAGGGGYDVSYQTSVYDYYNWESTEKHWYPEASDLNALHRAGWAQNFDVVGTSNNRTTVWPVPR